MSAANIYLTFDGNCEDVFNFYKSIFGGEFLSVNRFKEVPQDQGMEIGKEDEEKIMHITLPIGKDSVLMGSDTAAGYGGPIVQGNNFSI
jgi:PhnB protein